MCAFVQIPQYLNSLFPKENNNKISEYLHKNGERIIGANKKFLFNLLKDFLLFSGNKLPTRETYKNYPKKIAYRIMFL
jgi:hypothetical protein